MIRTALARIALGAGILAAGPAWAGEITGPGFRALPPHCPLHAPCDDRQVQPFEGSLGRPCGYRWRPTPSGTRKVRVCF
ncbi:hypothetical protein OCOJLMKI_4956 [Methylobacterium iners]|uniref:Uncharacterized protein n=1 Tax=Methylobacterium iners TaxID=418707 RepID=A0ABQ4S5F6_9HYPH|nr:hypothetical protein OCOJLMKI_4956 [Methylobacterium iners]